MLPEALKKIYMTCDMSFKSSVGKLSNQTNFSVLRGESLGY